VLLLIMIAVTFTTSDSDALWQAQDAVRSCSLSGRQQQRFLLQQHAGAQSTCSSGTSGFTAASKASCPLSTTKTLNTERRCSLLLLAPAAAAAAVAAAAAAWCCCY
jgi:hypothetical protein